jgi:hypothetical protein
MDPYSGKAHGLRVCLPLKGRTQEDEDTSAGFTLAMGCYATSEFFFGGKLYPIDDKKIRKKNLKFLVLNYKLDNKK